MYVTEYTSFPLNPQMQAELLEISLSTDLKEYCRRGYSEKSFNTSDLVWNASLARSFCKGKLTLKAEAFDILQNLSSTVYEVGGQGKTEKWNNTLPSYAMLHLMYKFSKSVAITIIFGLMVNLAMTKRLKRIPMVESLKSVE